jgi:hypothetical protein
MIGFAVGITLVMAIVLAGSYRSRLSGEPPASPAAQTATTASENVAALPDREPAAIGTVSATDSAALPVPMAETAAMAPAGDAAGDVGPLPPPTPAVVNDPEPVRPAGLPDPDPAARPESAAEAESPPVAPMAATASGPQRDLRWHPFWKPFRSELSARGFSDKLAQLTGLDYRVEKTEPGHYRVAFAYEDDADRARKVAAIEAATGLRLASGSF